MLKALDVESSERCRWHGTQLLYCFLIGSLCMAAAATHPAEEQGKRGREVDEHLTDTDQELLPDSLDVRQAVDDWTPSQVAHWLKKEGVTPWHQAQYLASLEDHTIDGHLLLSLHPRDILHALDADMQQERPDDFSRNLDLLHGKVEELRQAIVQNPVDFWEYRVAHRRRAAHILCGLALAPRVTIFYMLVYAREILFLVVGENGLSLLSLVLFIAAPNLAVSLYLSKVVKHAPALLVTIIGSHACIFLGHLASTRGMAYNTVLWDSIKADFYRALILLLATLYFQVGEKEIGSVSEHYSTCGLGVCHC